MENDKRHLQLRIDPKTRHELEDLSKKYGVSNSDVIRGVLFFGIPVFEVLTELSEKLVGRLMANLKRESRLKDKNK